MTLPRVSTVNFIGLAYATDPIEVQVKTPQAVWSVFVPTTPNPTTGFLVHVSEDQLARLEMSVAEAIKSIISLGAVAPDYPSVLPTSRAADSGVVPKTPS
jgi:uncharacterized membrane protein